MYIQNNMDTEKQKSKRKKFTVFEEFSNAFELERVIEQIHKLSQQGIKISEITERIFKSKEGKYRKWVERVCKYIETHGLERTIERYKELYLSLTKPKEEKSLETKLLNASKNSVERSLTNYIRQISLQKLREIIEAGMLLKQYEEQLRRESFEKLKNAYISERARRELLNESLILFLAGLIDKKTLAQIILSIALDELFETKIVVINTPGGETHGREEIPT